MTKITRAPNIQLTLNSPLATNLKKTIINNIFIRYIRDKANEHNLETLITADYLKQKASKASDETERHSKQKQTLNPSQIDKSLLREELMRYYSLFLVNCYFISWNRYGMPFYYPHYRKFSQKNTLQFILRIRILTREMSVQLILQRLNTV